MKELPRSLASLAAKQSGLLSRTQLLSAGFDSRNVATRISLGYWAAVTDRVVSIGPSILTRNSELWLAVLHYPDATLTGRAALEFLGFPGERGDRIDLISTRNLRNPPFKFVHVHHRADVLASTTGLPIVDVAAAVIDAVRFGSHLNQRCYFAIFALQRRLTTLEELFNEYERTKKTNGSHLVHKALSELSVGIEAMSELKFAKLCGQFGIPQPNRQIHRRDSDGKIRYLDAVWELPHKTVTAEIDGKGHLDYRVRLDDMFRDNSMTLQGSTTLRIPYLALRQEPSRWMRQLADALS